MFVSHHTGASATREMRFHKEAPSLIERRNLLIGILAIVVRSERERKRKTKGKKERELRFR
jgi:hypothetical protein